MKTPLETVNGSPIAELEDVLGFWFRGVGSGGLPSDDAVRRWFMGGADFDQETRLLFESTVDAALEGDLGCWAETPRGLLALVIVLDQLTRNVYRGNAKAFAGDTRAIGYTRHALGQRLHERFQPIERYFLYMPLEHAEDVEAQRQAVALFEALACDAPSGAPSFFQNGVDWARKHQAVIERFGRFPARNAALGRTSTPDEEIFLQANPRGF